jgi:diguanylate cyclase (GGDEF)-like protein
MQALLDGHACAAHESPTRDPLTGALTRHALFEALDTERRSAAGRRFWLLLIDLDHMKSINERYGQRIGDRVLCEAVMRLRRALTEIGDRDDLGRLARYDGDAFLVAARPDARREAELLAESLRFAIAAKPLATSVAVTASIGATEHRLGEPLDATLVRTEQALYLAKQFGRDRVEVALTTPQRAVSARLQYLGR